MRSRRTPRSRRDSRWPTGSSTSMRGPALCSRASSSTASGSIISAVESWRRPVTSAARERPNAPGTARLSGGELIRGGWKLKPIHRLIVTSAVYRQGEAIEAGREHRSGQPLSVASRAAAATGSGGHSRDSLLAVSGIARSDDVRQGIARSKPSAASQRLPHGETQPA